MELHQILKRAAEESLTIEDCHFFLSKTGQDSSLVLFKNYMRKYHPKNSSLSHFYDLRAKKIGNDIKYQSKLFKKKSHVIERKQFEKLPQVKRGEGQPLQKQWEKIIDMTEKEGIIKKGLSFPVIKIR